MITSTPYPPAGLPLGREATKHLALPPILYIFPSVPGVGRVVIKNTLSQFPPLPCVELGPLLQVIGFRIPNLRFSIFDFIFAICDCRLPIADFQKLEIVAGIS